MVRTPIEAVPLELERGERDIFESVSEREAP
jgi:hypothetical protein